MWENEHENETYTYTHTHTCREKKSTCCYCCCRNDCLYLEIVDILIFDPNFTVCIRFIRFMYRKIYIISFHYYMCASWRNLNESIKKRNGNECARSTDCWNQTHGKAHSGTMSLGKNNNVALEIHQFDAIWAWHNGAISGTITKRLLFSQMYNHLLLSVIHLQCEKIYGKKFK